MAGLLTDSQASILSFVVDYLKKDSLGTGQLDERASTKLSQLWDVFGYRSQLDFLNHLRDEPILTILSSFGQVIISGGSGSGGSSFPITWEPSSVLLGEKIGFSAISSLINTNLIGITKLSFLMAHISESVDIEYAQDATDITFPNLIDSSPQTFCILKFANCGQLVNLLFPKLEVVDEIDIFDNATLPSLSFPKLVAVNSDMFIDQNPSLTSMSFDSLVTCPTVYFKDNANLTSLNMPNFLPTNGSATNNFVNCSLNAASVNQLLARGVANPAFVSGAYYMFGGSSAAPSGQGIADKATLLARGVDVQTN